jgi:cytochrome c oxidase assembly protein subunit 15
LPRLAGLFLLGGAQGLLGWLMVASGLVDRPEVSPLRLAAHLLAALAIYAALTWSAFNELAPPAGRPTTPGGARRVLMGMLVLAILTMAVGALVAGLHAGLVYNSFPLMNGALIPAEAFAMSPWWLNLLANHALVQFLHRLLAIATWLASLALILGRTRLGLPVGLFPRLALIPVMATLQAGLGIATLLNQVPVPLAAAHQLGAFLLVTTILWALHGVSGAAPAVGRA